MRIRDAVHGDIVFEGELGQRVRRLIDTRAFQRLRHVRQNGVTNLVFPGAEHSRFTHSLGVAATAQRMLEAVARNSKSTLEPGQREATIFAALLHDIGHGPFSHTFEAALKGAGVPFKHEVMGSRLIREDPALSEALGEDGDLVIERITGTGKHWTKAIVSSQLDADRLDYVLRDAQLAGVHNLRPDVDRLVGNLYLYLSKDEELQGEELVVHRRAADVIESFLLALDHLYERVYFHKAVRAAALLLEATLGRAIELDERAFKGHAEPLGRLCKRGHEVDLSDFLQVSEIAVWGSIFRWQDSTDPVLSQLATRLVGRRLFKAIPLAEQGYRDACRLRAKAEELAREAFGADLAPYLVHLDDATRINYKRYSPSRKARDSIRLWSDEGGPFAIEDQPRSIVRTVMERIYKGRLYVPEEIHSELEEFARDEDIEFGSR